MNTDFLGEYREQVLKCSECGFCQADCPVFGATLRPAYNTRGKMMVLKELMEGTVEFSPSLSGVFYSCTLCQACSAACPAQVDAPGIVERTRQELYKKGLTPESLLSLRDNISSSGNVYGGNREDRIAIYPPDLRERARRGALGENAQTLLFMGCLPSYMDMKIVPSLLRIMESAGLEYRILGLEEECCGFPLYLMGADLFVSHAEKIAKKIRSLGVRELVTPCAGCYRTFSSIYPEFLDLGVEVYHTVQYLHRLIREEKLALKTDSSKRVTYHDPCDLGRGCGIYEEPREILKMIAGPRYVEMARNRVAARCCGGGGALSAFDPDLGVKMAGNRVRDALNAGAEIIVSGCPACKDNLRKGARSLPKEERGIKVMDITEVVQGATV